MKARRRVRRDCCLLGARQEWSSPQRGHRGRIGRQERVADRTVGELAGPPVL